MKSVIALSILCVTVSLILVQDFYVVHNYDVEIRVDKTYGYFGIGQRSTGKMLTYEYPDPDHFHRSNFVFKIGSYMESETYAWPPIESYSSAVDYNLNDYLVHGYPKELQITNSIMNKWSIPLGVKDTFIIMKFFKQVE